MSTVTTIKPSFSAGEIAPSVWGRVDFQKWSIGASVMRNCFVSYRGPASSRGGLAFVGQSLTPASPSSLPPKLVRFQFNIFQSFVLEFGVNTAGAPYMRVISQGAYVTESPVTVTNVTQANPGLVTAPAHGYVNGDWVYGASFLGMTQLNGRTFVVANATTNSFTLTDTFGNAVSTLNFGAYVSTSGTFSRIYTNFNSPYQLADLPFLKFVQSADLMSFCCVNQTTAAEYAPIDLTRIASNNWSFATTSFGSVIAAPGSCAATTNVTGSPATQYAYCVTAVDATTGEESVASNVAYITNSDDIALVAGSHTITWNPVSGAAYYNIYQAPPSYDTAVPVGSVFAFIGSAYGTSFVNSNILADQTQTPPLHLDPFARGQILSVGAIPQTGTFTQTTTTTSSINSATGSGGVIIPVVSAGSSTVVAGIVQNNGQAYLAGDTVTFTDSGSGNSVTAPLNIGPQTGTYPGVVDYFQQRRVYASTLNNPDTEFFSQTGAYTNMDSATPPIDSDAIVLTPWGTQVNGVQWLQPMPGGLISATGQDAWQVAGAGGAGATLTPASESATPQESNGFSPTVKPIRANYDILYVQELGYTSRDLQYNFFTNIYAGTDLGYISNHLFEGFQITAWAWAKIPYKIVWATRDDGKFLSLTYDKEEQLQGWARHDTNGLMQGVEVVTEPPVSAPYFVVKRFIVGVNQWAYYIERMDNRLWFGPEDPWCVDAGLALTQPSPNATLSAQAAEGPGNITGGYIATGGQGYSNPTAIIIDPAGTGSGGAITLTQSGGVLNGYAVTAAGQDYSPGTFVQINDPTGAGGTFIPFVSQNVIFNASSPVFGNNNPGDVIRVGGGIASVTTINTASQVLAAITSPILVTIPNDPNNLPVPAQAGDWSITTPVSTVSNLNHLEGMQVTGLYDGNVIPLTTVVNGAITVPQDASAITIGLPFIAQLQSLHAPDIGPEITQGKRKVTPGVNVRVEKTKGVQIGANQPVASSLDFQQEVPWTNMVDLPDYANPNVPNGALPLFTGDKFVPINDDWQNWNGFEASPGFIAVQQTLPLPMNVLALVPNWMTGDVNG